MTAWLAVRAPVRALAHVVSPPAVPRMGAIAHSARCVATRPPRRRTLDR